MTPLLWRRLDTLARRLLPCASTLAMSIVGVVPLHIPASAPAALSMSLIAVFYWSLYRPDLMPAWAAFVLGQRLSDRVAAVAALPPRRARRANGTAMSSAAAV